MGSTMGLDIDIVTGMSNGKTMDMAIRHEYDNGYDYGYCY